MSLFPTLDKEYLQSWGSEDPHRVLLGFISYSFTKISIRILTYMLNHLLVSSLIYSILLISRASGLQRWIIKVSWLWDTRYLLHKSRNQQWQDNLMCELTVLPNSDLAARCSKTNNWEENISRKERCFNKKSQQSREEGDLCPQTSSEDSIQPWEFVKGKRSENLNELRQEVGFCIILHCLKTGWCYLAWVICVQDI